MIDTLIFDLGGVLINWDPRHLYRKIFDDETTVENFLASVCTQQWNEQQDAGRSIATATTTLIDQFPHHETAIKAYYDRWTEMLDGPIDGTVKLLSSLRQSGEYKLLALTNWSAETFPHARNHFAFLSHFDDILVSGEVNLKKPDRRIFDLLLQTHSVTPSQAVFIDDAIHNVKAAGELGLHAIHFKSPGELKTDLEILGVRFDATISP